MFLFNPFEMIMVLFGLIFAYPWALILLPHERRPRLLLSLTTLALSLGLLTWSMMLLAFVGALSRLSVVLVMLLIFGAGVVCARSLLTFPRRSTARATLQQVTHAAQRHPLGATAILITLGITGLILLNAIYWPFGDDDAVSIYALHSLKIVQTDRFPTGEGLYEAYPMLLPLSYVYTYLIAGNINEYLARIIPALLAAGTLGAAASLGEALYNRRTGLLAMLLLALTPAFGRWAPTGYTDIPAAFFVTLAALFAWRLAESGSSRDAVLAGITVGLAAWTKNSALTLAGSLGIWLLLARWQNRIKTQHIGLTLAALLVTAGPWYARNWSMFGLIVPKTVWTDRAVHTLSSAFPFLSFPDQFFIPGLFFTAGLIWATYESLTPRLLVAISQKGLWDTSTGQKSGIRAWLLLTFSLPFAAAWWWMASYDARFLLAVLPLIAVMGARAIDWGWNFAEQNLTLKPRWRLILQIIMLVLLLGLAFPSARKALIFKGDMLRQPLMTNTERHRIRLGPIYDVAVYLNELPASGRVLSNSYFLPFHARTVEVIVGGMPDLQALDRYDYLVYSAGRQPPAFVPPDAVELLTEIEGCRVYRVVKDQG
ncbi:MAG: glycosyltransferase family 39 protein [Chloroflexi bacterium]|nr:glycosyltransferase family 39 protein [Chloroflexota bacterium]